MKEATTIEQQAETLRKRNVIITDEEKAKEILFDIGYYRLGFYFFPFEVSYPNLKNRTHLMKKNTYFSDAVALYYFDFDIRNIIMRYISRIEVAFRTYTTYILSNKYRQNPLWFVDSELVNQNFVSNFDITYSIIKKNQSIKHHHKKYPNDIYAPAWKTLEYMTFGNMLTLYHNLNNLEDKKIIAKHFGINQTTVFENYFEVIRFIRNVCAHGYILYDTRLYHQIKRGPAGNLTQAERFSFGGAIKVIAYMLNKISTNRLHDMIINLNDAYMKAINKSPQLINIIEAASKMNWNLSNISQLEKIIS